MKLQSNNLGISPKFIIYNNELLNIMIPKCSISSNKHFEHLNIMREYLDNHKKKQSFRVSRGKSKWINYESFDSSYNLREILDDEIVIEFDTNDKNIAWEGVNFTCINLYKGGYSFEVWDHKGKSPHIHIHNLPIKHLSSSERRTFKKLFIRKYVPLDYLSCVDISLTGIHLIAIEGSKHWKGKYDVKRLLHKFEPKEDLE